MSSGASIHDPAHGFDGRQALQRRSPPPPAALVRLVMERCDAHHRSVDATKYPVHSLSVYSRACSARRDVVERAEIGVIRRPARFGFALELLTADCPGRGFVRRDLDGHGAIEPAVFHEVDLAMPQAPGGEPISYGPRRAPAVRANEARGLSLCHGWPHHSCGRRQLKFMS